jgi:branched-chain amino acid transport system ATP-binding protein
MEKRTMTALLQVEGLTRRYGGLVAVNNLHLDIQHGEILGVIGPNGAGKSTAINLMSGVVRPSSGKVVFDGNDVTGIAPHLLVQRGLVRTQQATTVYAGQTVRENALRGAFTAGFPGVLAAFFNTAKARRMRAAAEERVEYLLELLGLTQAADSIADSLPYGYQKTLGMVIALAASPRLVMLDEPVAGLSAEEADHVRDTIIRVREQGISVLVVDHNMRFMTGLCDRVLVLHHGQELAMGRPQEVLSNPKVINAYLGHGHVTPQH